MAKINVIKLYKTGVKDAGEIYETDREVGQKRPSSTAPLLTWADWELLQELHKARNGEGTATVCFHNPDSSAAPGHNPDLFPSYDKQYESLAPRSSGPENPTFGCRQVALPRDLSAAGGGPAMNWQALAADLQDQIKDWETKCKQLETQRNKALTDASDIARALQRAENTLQKVEAQNAELSKSLQHYRNAYFADQGKEGDNDGQK